MEFSAMDHSQLTAYISRCLVLLETETQISTHSGMVGMNHEAESLLCGILNRIYDYDLTLANQSGTNHSAIDLADQAHSIAVQVTTIHTRRKIMHTIENFRRQELYRQYSILIIFVWNFSGKVSAFRDLKPEEFDLLIMGPEDLLQAIELCSTEKLQKIAKFLNSTLGVSETATVPASAHQLPALPAPAASFVPDSRDKDISMIRSYRKNTQVLFLCGPAGIGKTQLALQYAAKRPPSQDAFFLPYCPNKDPGDDFLRETILRADFGSYIFDSKDNDRHDQEYEDRLTMLRREFRDSLLIIDGVEWDDKKTGDALRDFLNMLAESGNISILVTTRSSISSPAFNVKPLAPEYSRQLMIYHGADRYFSEEELSSAAQLMEHFPLYVDRVAQLMGQAPDKIQLKQLQSQLAAGTSPMKTAAAIQLHLHKAMKTAFSPDSRAVLLFAALLPDDGLRESLFKYPLNNHRKRTLADLIDGGWIRLHDGIISVHPYIRQACMDAFAPTAEDFREYLQDLFHYENSFRWTRLPLLERKQAKRTLAQIYDSAATVTGDPQGLFSRISAELWHNIDYIPNALDAITRYVGSPSPDIWDMARAYHFAGVCHARLREYHSALNRWQQTLHICCNDLLVSEPDLATAHYHVGSAHLSLEQYQAAAKSLELARSFQDNTLSTDHPFREAVQNKIDLAYARLGQHRTALSYMADTLTRDGNARYLWTPIPAGVGLPSFFGREAELKHLWEKLQASEKPIVITGHRGTGKTELVVHFARNYTAGRVYFTRFSGSFFRTVAGLARNIRPTLSAEALQQPDSSLYQMVMDVLRYCGPSDILIIDDVDTIPGDEAAYQELLALDCRLIFTTASPEPSGICISSLPYEDLFHIFEKHSARLEHAQMRALVEAVNGHTLAVDLMARMIGSGTDKSVTAEELLNTFTHPLAAGVVPASTPDAMDPIVYSHLRTLLSLAQISEAGRSILRFGVLIPPQGISTELFLSALPAEYRTALPNLMDRGLVSADNGTIIFQAAVQTICRRELEPTDENCAPFLEALWSQYSPREYDAVKYRQIAEVFSIAAQTLDDADAIAVLHAVTILSAIGDHQRSKELLDSTLDRYEAILPPNSPLIAQLYNNFGRTCGELGMLSSALEYTMNALKIYEKICPADHPELAVSYHNVGTTYFSLGSYDIAQRYLKKALEIQLHVLPEGHSDLAHTYDSIADTYIAVNDPKQALDYRIRANEIFRNTLPPTHPLLAESFAKIGSSYAAMQKYSEALIYYKKVLPMYQQILPADDTTLADTMHVMGTLYWKMKKFSLAQEFLEASLNMYRQHLPAGHPTLVKIQALIDHIKAKPNSGTPLPL